MHEPVHQAMAPERQWAKTQPDWVYRELATGHDAMILAPGALAKMLLLDA